ncbi:MAG: hypothetical protein NT150_07055, partial [Bacteroidetes bacterium]|nr:hypothetical protein [Bacteroidota bacterium]
MRFFQLKIFLFLFSFSTYNALCQICPPTISPNLVVNPSFELGTCGSSGFTSDYLKSPTCDGSISEGGWGIVTNANKANPTYMTKTLPHTGGNLMVVDVGNSVNSTLWEQTIPAGGFVPNTTYFFSVWLANISNQVPAFNNPPVVQFRINGVAVGANIKLPNNTTGAWIPYYVTWKSPAGVQADVAVSLENMNKTGGGNDLAIDDLSFSSSCANVPNINDIQPKSKLSSQISLCSNGGSALLDTKLSATNKSFIWKNSTPTVIGGNTSSTSVVAPGTYYVCIDSAGLGCPITDTVTVIANMAVDLPDQTLCNPLSTTLNTDIVNTSYFNSIKWFKNNIELTGESGKAAITINETGTYKVVIDGPSTCDATDQAVIATLAASTPINGTFCATGSGKATLGVNGVGPFNWFKDITGGTSLGTGKTFVTPVLTAPGPHTFYAEDQSIITTSAGPNTAPCAGTTEGVERSAVKFVAYEDYTLADLKVMHDNYGGTGTDDFIVYLSNDVAGKPGPAIQTSATFSTDKPATPTAITIPTNFKITGSPAGTTYWITMKTGPAIRSMNCAGTFPYKDAAGGSVTAITGTYHDGNAATTAPAFFGFSVKKGTSCGRIPVIATEDCPTCLQPTSASITSSVAAVSKIVTICPNTAVTLTGAFVAGVGTPTNGMQYVWYKSGTPVGAYTATPLATKALTGAASDAGWWILRVEDGSAGTSTCYKEDSVKIVFSPVPAVTAMTAKICSGAAFTVTPVDVTNGVVPAGTTYTWSAPTG